MALIEDHSQVRGEEERTETWDATHSKKKKKKALFLFSFLSDAFFSSMSEEDYGAAARHAAYFRLVARLTV